MYFKMFPLTREGLDSEMGVDGEYEGELGE